jgi:protein-disulfide isomerase
MLRFLSASTLALGFALLPACSNAGSMSDADFGKRVKDYLLENPETLVEALQAYEKKQAEDRTTQLAQLARENADALYKTAGDPSIGPANAKVTVVEFFDYRCGYCKRSVNWVQALPKANRDQVRVVFKELPIFGGVSETAALAALAASKQGKYNDMHLALMRIENNDDLTDAAIDAAARSVGINVTKMRADMASDDVKKQLGEMMALGQALQVGGTPGFFVGDKHIEGANTSAVEKAINEALKG